MWKFLSLEMQTAWTVVQFRVILLKPPQETSSHELHLHNSIHQGTPEVQNQLGIYAGTISGSTSLIAFTVNMWEEQKLGAAGVQRLGCEVIFFNPTQ